MYNIAIIGAGQLGSRHLQGLKKAQLDMSIQVVDSSTESLAVAKSRYEEVEDNAKIGRIEFLTDISSLTNSLDLVIVATSSAPRAAIVETLLTQKEVKNLVLEKFLFPSMEQYDRIYKLLEGKKLLDHTWVNCTRRMFDHYDVLADRLANDKVLEMEIVASNWGLCCNSVHFIDIFAKMTNQTDWSFGIAPDSKLIDSKRGGYIEIQGAISGVSKRGDKIILVDMRSIEAKPTMITRADGSTIEIDEANGFIIENGVKTPIQTTYQSGLTNLFAEDILIRNSCRLTPYTESQKIHKAVLLPIVEFYNKATGKNSDSCPIT